MIPTRENRSPLFENQHKHALEFLVSKPMKVQKKKFEIEIVAAIETKMMSKNSLPNKLAQTNHFFYERNMIANLMIKVLVCRGICLTSSKLVSPGS